MLTGHAYKVHKSHGRGQGDPIYWSCKRNIFDRGDNIDDVLVRQRRIEHASGRIEAELQGCHRASRHTLANTSTGEAFTIPSANLFQHMNER